MFTIIGRAQATTDGIELLVGSAVSTIKSTIAKLGSFGSIGFPWKSREVVWKRDQGKFPPLVLNKTIDEIYAGSRQLSLNYTTISQRDAEGT